MFAATPLAAVEAARELGGDMWVVKAQVHAGGRGKAGGIKLAASPDEARGHAEKILGMDIDGPEGDKGTYASKEAALTAAPAASCEANSSPIVSFSSSPA